MPFWKVLYRCYDDNTMTGGVTTIDVGGKYGVFQNARDGFPRRAVC
jgi:hypothetical protein